MFSDEEKNAFRNVAESLKKYRRADLSDNGKDILDNLYVDLLPDNAVINKCLLDNTTFLIGRKGTGKSTIFLKMEHEYRKKASYFPCYIDVKTVFESSRTKLVNCSYLEQYLNPDESRKYLISRTFIQSMLSYIYKEIDCQKTTLYKSFWDLLTGNDKLSIKKTIWDLNQKINNNDAFENIEIPYLQQRKRTKASADKAANSSSSNANIGATITPSEMNCVLGIEGMSSRSYEQQYNSGEEFSELLLQVFDVKAIIQELKGVLSRMGITKLVVMLDDVSEIEDDALLLFMDTIVTPLNNWSDDFIKFKIAFYPGRVHYGKIDPGKIDIIKLDFYDLYSPYYADKMEEYAIDFTSRLLDNHFEYYLPNKRWKYFFDSKLSYD